MACRWMAPCHHLNQSWPNVNWTLRPFWVPGPSLIHPSLVLLYEIHTLCDKSTIRGISGCKIVHYGSISSPIWHNGPHFEDNIFKSKTSNEIFCILIKISLNFHFVPEGMINSLWPSEAKATRNWVNIGSGNGLLPDGTKPLPEPMLTYHQ